MSKEVNKEIIELFRTRRFTVVTHDRGEYDIYVGRYYNYEDLPEEADYHVTDTGLSTGYLPPIVELLVEALGGTCDSI